MARTNKQPKKTTLFIRIAPFLTYQKRSNPRAGQILIPQLLFLFSSSVSYLRAQFVPCPQFNLRKRDRTRSQQASKPSAPAQGKAKKKETKRKRNRPKDAPIRNYGSQPRAAGKPSSSCPRPRRPRRPPQRVAAANIRRECQLDGEAHGRHVDP